MIYFCKAVRSTLPKDQATGIKCEAAEVRLEQYFKSATAARDAIKSLLIVRGVWSIKLHTKYKHLKTTTIDNR